MERDLITGFNPMLPQVEFLDAVKQPRNHQSCTTSCEECIGKIKTYIDQNREMIAGFMIEPIFASKGIVLPCKEFLKKLVQLCRSHEILIAFDEVVTGFYRTGASFYYKKLDIVPDLLCLSKGINSGYLPAGAVLVGDKITKAYHLKNTILEHGSTQAGNLLVCASITAALQEYKKLDEAENLNDKSLMFYHTLFNKLHQLDLVQDIRSEGFMFAIEIRNKDQKNRIKMLMIIMRALEKEGILAGLSETGLVLMPMLITTMEQWKTIVDSIYKVFQKFNNANNRRE
jgi:adenosylmethionine-8-amino-7-oxononanoate aminotransferase